MNYTVGPYRGSESYQTCDADVFFGREWAAREVIDRVRSSPVTVLHAAAGTGRTSLIHARILPELECEGWSVVLARPNDNPRRELQSSMIEQLLPCPQHEALAVREATVELAAPGEALSLGDLLDRFSALAVADVRRQRLLGGRFRRATQRFARPFFSRLLQRTIDLRGYEEHLQSLHSDTSTDPLRIDSATQTALLSNWLSAAPLERAYRELLEQLEPGRHAAWPFLERWKRVWASRFRRYGLVIVLESFEELFTRFSINSRSNDSFSGLGPRVRDEFLEELREVAWYAARENGSDADSGSSGIPLSLRLLVSLREEYLALLDPARQFYRYRDGATYRLVGLSPSETAEAITGPAQILGFHYDDQVVESIVKYLAADDESIHPPLVQLVCSRLWSHLQHHPTIEGTHRIDLASYEALGGMGQVLSGVLDEVLDSMERADRSEALELLEALISPTGVRKFVELSELIQSDLSNDRGRQEVLHRMASRGLVELIRFSGRVDYAASVA